jgi:hypothetical protein
MRTKYTTPGNDYQRSRLFERNVVVTGPFGENPTEERRWDVGGVNWGIEGSTCDLGMILLEIRKAGLHTPTCSWYLKLHRKLLHTVGWRFRNED